MLTFFDDLPRELRDVIYEELLLDRAHVMQPAKRFLKDLIERRKLYPGILQTCKQAYSEGSDVLYGQNEFLFSLISHPGLARPLANGTFANLPHPEVFAKIKHVFIAWMGETPHLLDNQDHDQCVKHIINVGTFIQHSGASLKTLRILLTVRTKPTDYSLDVLQDWEFSISENEMVDTVPRIAYSDTLRQSLAKLRISKSIDITVDSNYEGDCEIMMAFASRIGNLKQWPLVEVQKRWEEGVTEYLDDYDPSSGLIGREYCDVDEDDDVIVETSFTTMDEDFGEDLWRNRQRDKTAWIDHRKAGGKLPSEMDRYVWTWFLGNY